MFAIYCVQLSLRGSAVLIRVLAKSFLAQSSSRNPPPSSVAAAALLPYHPSLCSAGLQYGRTEYGGEGLKTCDLGLHDVSHVFLEDLTADRLCQSHAIVTSPETGWVWGWGPHRLFGWLEAGARAFSAPRCAGHCRRDPTWHCSLHPRPLVRHLVATTLNRSRLCVCEFRAYRVQTGDCLAAVERCASRPGWT